MLNIGNVTLKNGLIAAPLAGISNPVYRTMLREYGADLCVSEMISDKALHYNNAKTKEMCRVFPVEHPVSLQLFSGDPVTMAEAVRFLDQNTDCDIIDINMGCPVTKVLKAHSGSWLMAHPDVAVDLVKAAVDNTKKPVTVKMRAGWDSEHINCAELAHQLEAAGASAIAVHGRTKAQMYSGRSSNLYIKAVKEAVKIPVIGNGDIQTVEDAFRMKQETGCDGLMIGRGLLGRPWFMQELKCAMESTPFQEPSYMERLDQLKDYAKKLTVYEGEHTGIAMMRGMAAWYLTGMPDSARVKASLSRITSLNELNIIVDTYKEKLQEQVR